MVYCNEFLAIKEAPRCRMIQLPEKKFEKLFSLEKLNSTMSPVQLTKKSFKWSHVR